MMGLSSLGMLAQTFAPVLLQKLSDIADANGVGELAREAADVVRESVPDTKQRAQLAEFLAELSRELRPTVD
ncbi:MAG: hypothetical protein AB1762_12905 [Gemmatimonadota bacterium]